MKKTGFLLSILAVLTLFSVPNALADEASSGGSIRKISEKQDKISLLYNM